MPSFEEIRNQLSSLDGYDQLVTRKEIKELPGILWDDENINKVVSGFYNNGNGLLIATGHRVIFVDKGMFGNLKVEDFPFDKVSSIQYETGMMFGKITIFASSNKATIEQVDKNAARSFAESVRRMISSPQNDSAPRTRENEQETSNKTNSISELERLAKLYSDGLLTEEEFSKAKKKFLE